MLKSSALSFKLVCMILAIKKLNDTEEVYQNVLQCCTRVALLKSFKSIELTL